MLQGRPKAAHVGPPSDGAPLSEPPRTPWRLVLRQVAKATGGWKVPASPGGKRREDKRTHPEGPMPVPSQLRHSRPQHVAQPAETEKGGPVRAGRGQLAQSPFPQAGRHRRAGWPLPLGSQQQLLAARHLTPELLSPQPTPLTKASVLPGYTPKHWAHSQGSVPSHDCQSHPLRLVPEVA